MNKKWLSWLRILVSVGIIAFFVVFKRQTLITFWHTLQNADLKWFIVALVGYIPVIHISLLRWNALLKVQDVHFSYSTMLRLFFIGAFFNNFTLGVTGGDVIKAYYVSHEAKHLRAAAVMTVFLDRIVGIFALFALALIALFFTHGDPHLDKLNKLVWGLFLGSLVVGFILFKKSLLKKIPGGEALMQKLPFYQGIRKVYNAFHLYHRHKGVLLLTFAQSMLLQTIMICVIALLGWALKLQGVGLKHYFLFFPIIATLSALPISVGGLGVGEASFVYFFGLIGVPSGQAFALGLATRFIYIIWGLVGGVVYMLPSNKITKEEAEKELELEKLEKVL